MLFGRRTSLALLVGLAVATVGLPASPGQATGETVQETGKVTGIIDGDTIIVKVGSSEKHVRLLGVNAMETYHPTIAGSSNACHSVAATNVTHDLVMGKTVQLRAISKSSESSGRLLRSVWVEQNGEWVDIQRILLTDSLALPLPWGQEPTHNLEYLKLAQQEAKKSGARALWNTRSCQPGPAQDVPISVLVHWDADGNDAENLNDEWVSVQNHDPAKSLSLTGWWVRDGSNKTYKFPKGTKVPPRGQVMVRVGHGTNTKTTKHWNLSAAVFDNDGDGAYLFDPDGDLRAHMIYPCKVSCTDPAKGLLRITKVSYDPKGGDNAHVNGEYVRIKNTSSHRIHLRPYLLGSYPYTYVFRQSAWLAAGATVTVHVGKGKDTAAHKYWGMPRAILNNPGDSVQLMTYDEIRLACKAWGTARC